MSGGTTTRVRGLAPWTPQRATRDLLDDLVPAQIVSLGLQTAPAKPTDKRSFEGETVQCEAIPPDVLAAIVKGAIEDRLNHDAYELVLAKEEMTRGVLAAQLRPLLDDGSS